MELNEYLGMRKAYNLARHKMAAGFRLTFAEYAIMVFLDLNESPVLISHIAEYQGSLRPTMTHRIKHLSEIGFVERTKGDVDARNVLCSISLAGQDYLKACVRAVIEELRKGTVLTRIQAKRVMSISFAMCPYCYMSGDLVLLGIVQSEQGCATVSGLVEMLGLLQPTVSMSVSTLEKQGLVERMSTAANGGRSSGITLTERGLARANELVEEIMSISVRRTQR